MTQPCLAWELVSRAKCPALVGGPARPGLPAAIQGAPIPDLQSESNHVYQAPPGWGDAEARVLEP